MKNVLFYFSFLLISISGFSQEFQLSGKVTSEKIPLYGATVKVEGTEHGTLTDANGEYSLFLPDGSYILIFSYGNRKEIAVTLTKNLILNVEMSDAKEILDEVFLSAVRVDADSPITHSNLSEKEIENRNLGQDIPVLMNYMPSVVTTSDAGAGVGYTGIRVRGSNAINVTINGIPYNDSESQGTFWVNLGDFASSTENLQLQRGVGTSTNGAGAFGASINLLTTAYQEKASAEISSSFGSFNTWKNTAEIHSGLINDHWGFYARASKIKSDGYIDRASSDLKSYFLQASFTDENTLFKALAFGGKEITYQAWFGIDKDKLENDRTYNPAGIYSDEEGNVKFYENQTDNYQQDHYQLLWNQEYNNFWSSNIALHLTYGKGYYEEYEEDADLKDFGLKNFMANGKPVNTSDLVNRSWLDNYFYGTVFSLNYEKNNINVVFGGGLNKYVGDHFGEVIYTRFAQNKDPYEPFYKNTGYKTDFNFFGKTTWKISDKIAIFGDLQLRNIHYKTEGPLADRKELMVNDNFTFFNPKAGFTYQLDEADQFYISYAKAHREPNRSDYENGNPVPEELNDFELGWRHDSQKFDFNTNLYYMRYKNQFVLTGAIDDEGAPIRENSGNSYRLGLEVNASVLITPKISIRPTFSLSRNKNIDFVSNFDGELVAFGDTDISFSPEIVASNKINYFPIPDLEIRLLSKFVGKQFMSNIETDASVLENYFINDFNIQYSWKKAPLFEEVVFTGLINNIFDVKYVSNGYYFSYDVEDPTYPTGFQTVEGAGFYPQAGINFLAGVTLRF